MPLRFRDGMKKPARKSVTAPQQVAKIPSENSAGPTVWLFSLRRGNRTGRFHGWFGAWQRDFRAMAACEQERSRTLFVDGICDCREHLAFASWHRAGEATLSYELSARRRFSRNFTRAAIFRRRHGVGASHGAHGRNPPGVTRRRRTRSQTIGNPR